MKTLPMPKKTKKKEVENDQEKLRAKQCAIAYARLLAIPQDRKTLQKNVDRFANDFGVSKEELLEMESSSGFWKLLKQFESEVGDRLMPAWFSGIERALTRGDVAGLKFYAQYFRKWKPEISVKHSLLQELQEEIEELEDSDALNP